MITNYIRKNKAGLMTAALMLGITAFFLLVPELSFAQFGGGGSGFESKVQSINTSLITRILPLVSIFWLRHPR